MEKITYTKSFDDYFNGSTEEGVANSLSPLPPKIDTIVNEVKLWVEKSVEITVTFKEELISIWKEPALSDMVRKIILRYVKMSPTKAGSILIGEHSLVGRYHYHGIIYGMSGDIVAKLKRSLARHIGRVEIKMIKYTESYVMYMFKSYNILLPDHFFGQEEREYYCKKDSFRDKHCANEEWGYEDCIAVFNNK